jgi:hypothetical protein
MDYVMAAIWYGHELWGRVQGASFSVFPRKIAVELIRTCLILLAASIL